MGSDPRPNTMLLTSNVVAVSKRLAVHSVLALRQCVAGWLHLRMFVVDDLCATARWQQGRERRLAALPAHRQAVRPVAGAAAGRRGTTEERLSSMERRLEASDKMLQEVHAMVRGLQQLPATNALPAPPPIAVPVSMAASAEGGEPIAPPLANLCLYTISYIKPSGIICGRRSTKTNVSPVARGYIFRYPYR